MILQYDSPRPGEVQPAALFAGAAPGDRIFDLFARGQRIVDGLPFLSADLQPSEKREEETEDFSDVEENDAAAQTAASIEVARVEGYEQARREFGEELPVRLHEERQRSERLRLEFARDRQRFFAAAESQVVQLALAVARKILARDAEVGGLPLRATVKAALARVQDGSSTVLRVSPQDQEAWLDLFPQANGGGAALGSVKVFADAEMEPGDCVLDTSLGRVELGVSVQMEEVERGFRDLMQNQEDE